MDAKTLKEVLENHKHWLNEDCDGWENMRADLSEADLRGADLSEANLYRADLSEADLRGADLSEADLSGAYLSEANLSGAYLSGADLSGAYLRGANLSGADLSEADLRGADLSEANLSGAYLRGADLRGANLRGANLYRADLRGANLYRADLSEADLRGADLSEANLYRADLSEADLRGADLRGADLSEADLSEADLRGAKNVPFIPLTCPDTGVFIGFKKAKLYNPEETDVQDVIVELEISSDARRSSATGRKCRCDKAKVLSVTTFDGAAVKLDAGAVRSNYDSDFVYEVGRIVTEPNFSEDRWEECAPGIHFFINRQEAVEY